MGLAHTLAQFQGPRLWFLEQSLFSEGKKVKRECPKAKEGVCQADEPGKSRAPQLPSLQLGKGPRSLLAPHFLSGKQLTPHPTVGDKEVGVQVGTITEVRGKQGKEATATTRAAKWSSDWPQAFIAQPSDGHTGPILPEFTFPVASGPSSHSTVDVAQKILCRRFFPRPECWKARPR